MFRVPRVLRVTFVFRYSSRRPYRAPSLPDDRRAPRCWLTRRSARMGTAVHRPAQVSHRRKEARGGMTSTNAPRSQRDRVLADLVESGSVGVCGSYWYQGRIPNARNHVSTLRASGVHIDSERCGDEHEAGYFRYWLRHDRGRTCPTCSGAPQQLSLNDVAS
jgi:hypothetical protein